jgi:O-succinylhomoserine sulfhydrylase
MGSINSPQNCYLLQRGLKTFELRVARHNENGQRVAEFLEAHPRVEKVYYPGLSSHPQHELAKRQQRASGSVVSFEVKGGRAAAWRVIDATRLLSVTANLGDVKTTIIHPASTTHGRISPEARAAAGITEGLIRVAVGLEALPDLKADLSRGLEAE